MEWYRDAPLSGQGSIKHNATRHQQRRLASPEQTLPSRTDTPQPKIDRNDHLGYFVAPRCREGLATPLGQYRLVGFFDDAVGKGFGLQGANVGIGDGEGGVDGYAGERSGRTEGEGGYLDGGGRY